MAIRTVGDTVTGANNVTGVVADYGSWQAAENAASAGDTIQAIRNADLGTCDVETDDLLFTAHADCAVATADRAVAETRARAGYFILYSDDVVVESIYIEGTVHALIFDGAGDAGVARRLFLVAAQCCIIFANTSQASNIAAVAEGGYSGILKVVGGSTGTCYHLSLFMEADNLGFDQNDGSLVANACIVQGPGNNFSVGVSGDFNVSTNTSAPGSSSSKYARSETGWFEDETTGAQNLALDAGKQGWWAANKDAIDQTGWPADVATDIEGRERSSDIDPGVWQTPGGGSEETFTPDPAEATTTAVTAAQALVATSSSAAATAPAPTLAQACAAATGSATAGTAGQAAIAGIATATATTGATVLAQASAAAAAAATAPAPTLALVPAPSLATMTAGAELTFTPEAAEAIATAVFGSLGQVVPATPSVATGSFGALALVPAAAPATITAGFHEVALARIGPFRLVELARVSVREQSRIRLREGDRR